MNNRIITVQMKISAPEDVCPAEFFGWLSWEIEHWHPNNPLSVESGSASVPSKRGPKPQLTDETRKAILAKHAEGMPKAKIAANLGINRTLVQRTIKGAGK